MARRIARDKIRNASTADLSATADLGDQERWRSRYQGEQDLWRDVLVRMISIPRERLCLERKQLVARLRSLQLMEHPGIEALRDFWLDKDALICVFDQVPGTALADWLGEHGSQMTPEFVQEYIGILIYGASLSVPLDLHGFRQHLVVSTSEPRLRLCSNFCIELLQRDATNVSESTLIEDACAFAGELGIALPTGVPTLHKLRNLAREKSSHA